MTTETTEHLQPAGEHTARMWEQTADIRARIEQLPFLTQLADGTLDPEKFAYYIGQDTHYLDDYQRAMLLIAARAPIAEEMRFWAKSAVGAIAEEKEMHKALSTDRTLQQFDLTNVQKALPTFAYGSYLVASAATDPYPVAATSVLPCYWIFADAGRRLAATAAVVKESGADHPYATWAHAYGDEGFQSITGQAIAIVERALTDATAAERDDAMEAFRRATRLEELFWEAPMGGEDIRRVV
ncbi:TenA family protein [Helcobacillus massiliensis]|uniref:TenA family protein n=1 Tax=Helcobacillus TaxID=1161125 RepID=UPI001EF5BA58|nr:TenA family protein [Helcobacillus massiliensis]MCG7426136.1 TenA family protein [Helcobacillus sp. ACRRO]MCT1557731.1 TenA family protein [Helcobacillus massiliensis]MCT2036003.1 TenA family protein [Helcobacillus massiliensis]MCT2331727.1 TenA family protein [Helcobacillus massiliensis]